MPPDWVVTLVIGVVIGMALGWSLHASLPYVVDWWWEIARHLPRAPRGG